MAEHGSTVAARRLVRVLESERRKHEERTGDQRGFQGRAAKGLGVDPGYVGRLMDGTRIAIGLKMIEQAMKAYSLPAGYFLDNPGGPDPDPETFAPPAPKRPPPELEVAMRAREVGETHRAALRAIPFDLFGPVTLQDCYGLIAAIQELRPATEPVPIQDGPAAVRNARGK